MQVIAESPLAAVVAAFLEQGQKIAAELVDRVDIFRKFTQVLSQQILQFVPAQVDARRRRFFAEGLAGLVPDQAGLDRAGVATVNLCQLGQGQILLDIGGAYVAPLFTRQIRHGETGG